MAKYINADEVIEKLREVDSKGLKANIYSLVALVTAMNESVIRCKDCKYYKCDIIFNFQDWNCDNDNGLANCNPTDYCSYAERKEETE